MTWEVTVNVADADFGELPSGEQKVVKPACDLCAPPILEGEKRMLSNKIP